MIKVNSKMMESLNDATFQSVCFFTHVKAKTPEDSLNYRTIPIVKQIQKVTV